MNANEKGKSGFFQRSGCEYVQEWMRMVSEYTEVVANSFGESTEAAAGARRGGETRGRGRMDQHHEAHGRALKRICIYLLRGDV